MSRQRIKISNEQDRLDVAKILIKNGYSARTTKVKATPTGKTTKTVLEYWEEKEQ